MDQPIAPVTPANPAAIHDAVSTHLRPQLPRHSRNCSKRIATHRSPPPIPSTKTKKQRKQRRRALQEADVAPVTAQVPSPYHQPLPSSPYVFDHDFYNNDQIMNGDVSFEDAIFGAQTNRQAKHLHRAHDRLWE